MNWSQWVRGTALALLLPQVAHCQLAPTPAPFTITHVSIIDTEGGPLRSDMTVVIREGRIARIDPPGAADQAVAAD